MNYIYIGDIVNTHGIKGELKIISHFKYKNNVFIKGTPIYIGKNKEKQVIDSYRKHKIFDMITLLGFNDINEVLKYKGEPVYIDKNEIKIDGILNEELIDMDVYNEDSFIGKVTDILNNGVYDILVIEKENNKNLVPNINEFIKNIDLENKKIQINMIEGLINEN